MPSTSDIIAITTAVIAALTGIGAIVTAVNARREAAHSANAALKSQQEATRVADEVARLQALDWTGQYFEGVREWSEEVVMNISTLIHLHEIGDDTTRCSEWSRARISLSALCDRGRWFFPNKFETEYGPQKALAYRGLRRRILDHIIEAYNAVPLCPAHGDRIPHDSLVKFQRGFVSEVQIVLNPRHREDQVQAIMDRFGIAEKMRIPNEEQE